MTKSRPTSSLWLRVMATILCLGASLSQLPAPLQARQRPKLRADYHITLHTAMQTHHLCNRFAIDAVLTYIRSGHNANPSCSPPLLNFADAPAKFNSVDPDSIAGRGNWRLITDFDTHDPSDLRQKITASIKMLRPVILANGYLKHAGDLTKYPGHCYIIKGFQITENGTFRMYLQDGHNRANRDFTTNSDGTNPTIQQLQAMGKNHNVVLPGTDNSQGHAVMLYFEPS